VTRTSEFAELYDERRFRHQRDFYVRARDEYRRSKAQLVWVSAVLLAASAFLGVLAGLDFDGKGVVLALASIVPAISTAAAAYEGLYAFERHAKLYGDAIRSLDRLRLTAPGTGASEADVTAYVEQVEGVLVNEQAQWGQLEVELGKT
jgi:hypothetical protein